MVTALSPWNFGAALVPGYRVFIGRATPDRWAVYAMNDAADCIVLGAYGRAGARLFATLDAAYRATLQTALDGRVRGVFIDPRPLPAGVQALFEVQS